MEKSKNSIKNFFSSLKKQDTPQYKIYAAIIAIILVIFLVYISKKIFKKYKDYKNSKLWILKGTKSARQRTIILQDPSLTDSKTIKRSKNEEAGIEFTYMFWVFINDDFCTLCDSLNKNFKWTCYKCKYQNKEKALICKICDKQPSK